MTTDVAPTDLASNAARALVDSIKADVHDLGDRIVTAYTGRAWLALGYAGWDALCEAEFDGARLRIPREQRAEQVQSLRSAGLSTRAIGSVLGVHHDTVASDIKAATVGNPTVDSPAAVHSLDGRERPASQPPRPPAATEPVKVTVRDTHTTAERFIAQRETGEVLSPEQWEQQNQPDQPVTETLAAARAEAARHPSIVTGEAMKHLERARRALLVAGTPTENLADHDTDSIDTTGDWLYEIDASIAVLTPLAAALRRRHIRSVK
jgi:hypothetical protein